MIIEAESISAGYNRRSPVLRSVSLSAESGDALALLGPNGSGKSTLLKVLGGLLPIRSGSVRIDGTPIHRIPPKERARILAFLPQDPVLPGGITVEELVRTGRFPCRNTPFSAFSKEDEAAVTEALEKTGMSSFRKRLLSSLSGGERRKARIAMTLAQKPKILLLDEPTAFLYPAVSLNVAGLIHKLAKENGLTVITVLHDLNLAARFCSKAAFLRSGNILKTGTIPEVMTPETVKLTFDLDVRIMEGPGGTPFCMPL
ncbi:MAG: ABC transporter ATP-binding protein [Lentisphaeria bacterium]|nr:ABC transporter ATP-binding protein [Lentisphaeria bacterium]